MIQLFRPKYEVEACLKGLREVLESGWTGTGPKCKELENEWSGFVGSPSLFLNSATAGLHIALRCLNLPPGSKVATTPITFVSTNAVILYENLVPIFCDVNPIDMTISRSSLMQAIADGAKAVIWVHYAGNANMDFDSLNVNIPIIEDCAHAGGSFYFNGERVGSRRDTISVFSFQAVKNMPTFDGGMLCSHDSALMERARKLSWLGIDKNTFDRTSGSEDQLYKWKYNINELGWKYNGNDIAAAIGLAQLNVLDRDNAYRRQIYRWYRSNFLGTHVHLLHHNDGSSTHFCAVAVKNRDEVLAELRLNGIAPGVHYLPNYEFPVFKKFYVSGSCPSVEEMSKNILTLPTHLLLSKSDIDRISEIVLRRAISN